MPISTADIKVLKHSTDPSLGRGASSLYLSSLPSTLHALFDPVQPAEAAAGDVEYRVFYIYNGNATDSFIGLRVYIQSNTTSPSTSIKISLGTTTTSPTGNSADGTVSIASGLSGDWLDIPEALADEATAPVGLTFSTASSLANSLLIGTVGPRSYVPVYVERTVTAGAATLSADTATLVITNAVPV